MKPRFLFAALALAYASHTSTTFAQAFLSDHRIVEGEGIKTGNFELHPGLAAEGGYDSNYFQGAGVERGVTPLTPGGGRVDVVEPVIDVWRLRITPSLSLESHGYRAQRDNAGPLPSVTFAANAAASYNALWANDGQWAHQATNQDDVGVGVGAGLNVFPGRTWGGDLGVNYNRIVEASNDPSTSNAWKRDNIRGGGGISFRPGGGLFSARVGYVADATLFESDGFTIFNNIRHTLQLGTGWRFLPRTALLYRGDLTWLNYTNSPATLGEGQSFDSEIGLNGLVSNYFGLLGMIGWAGSFYTTSVGNTQNFDGIIGQAQVTWYPHPEHETTNPMTQTPMVTTAPVGLSTVALGYTRNFEPSYLGTFFQRDRGYLNTVYFFGERFVLSLQGGFSHITRPPTWFATGEQQAPHSEENRVDALAFLEYRIGPQVGINATFRYDAELEHRVYQLAFNSPTGDDLKFNRYQVFLGVRWFL